MTPKPLPYWCPAADLVRELVRKGGRGYPWKLGYVANSIDACVRRGLIEPLAKGEFKLTPEGLKEASRIIAARAARRQRRCA